MIFVLFSIIDISQARTTNDRSMTGNTLKNETPIKMKSKRTARNNYGTDAYKEFEKRYAFINNHCTLVEEVFVQNFQCIVR